jgi:hypothetical protein
MNTQYVKITAKGRINYTATIADESIVGKFFEMEDYMVAGDTAIGFVNPAEITSRAKTIRILEIEDGLHHISVLPRSKVKVERLDCAMSIKDFLMMDQ